MDVSSVTEMISMFNNATAFNQNLKIGVYQILQMNQLTLQLIQHYY